tara:strand:+ start:66175 stop:68412 length:2238 start_codon:yes stop_codon:yes gene_type:complete
VKKKYPPFWKTLLKLVSRGERGFSLAEVMVAAGLLGVVSLGVMQVMQNISKGSKKMEQDAEKSSVSLTLNSVLKNQDNCAAWLGGLTVTTAGTAIPEIRTTPTAATPFMTVGTVYGQGTKAAQRVTALQLFGFKTGAGVADNSIAPAGYTQYQYTDGAGLQTRRRGTVEVRVTLNKGHAGASADGVARSSFGGAQSVIRMNLEVVTTTANVIESCFGDSDQFSTAACNALGGSLANDGTCRNIVIQNDSSRAIPATAASVSESNRFAMTVKGPVVFFGEDDNLTTGAADDGLEDGGVIIAIDQGDLGDTNATAPTGTGPSGTIVVTDDRDSGDLDVQGRVRIGFGGVTADQNLVGNGELQVQRNTILQGNVSIGNVAVPAYATTNNEATDLTNGFLVVEANTTTSNLGVGEPARPFPANSGYLDVALDADINQDLMVHRNATIDQNTRSENIGVGKAAQAYAAGNDGYLDVLRDIRTDRDIFVTRDGSIGQDLTVTRNATVVNGNLTVSGGDGNGNIVVSNGNINLTNANNALSYIRLRATPPYTGLTTEQTYRVPNIQWVRNYVVEEIAKTFTTNGTDLNALRADILNVADSNAGIETIKAYTCDGISLRDKDGNVIGESGTCSFPSNDTRCDSNGKCTNVYAGTTGANSGTLYGWRICIGTNRTDCKTSFGGSLNLTGCATGSTYIWSHANYNPDDSTAGSSGYYNYLCPAGKLMAGLQRRYLLISSGYHQWRSYIYCCSASL